MGAWPLLWSLLVSQHTRLPLQFMVNRHAAGGMLRLQYSFPAVRV